MPKYKVGDKFKVVDSSSSSEGLQEGKIHVITEALPLASEDEPTQFYESKAASWQWYLEEAKVHNQLTVRGLTRIFAVLRKIEEPDT